MILEKASSIKGTLILPGDNSITQKAIAVASIAEGKSMLYGYLESCETNATIAAFRSMGVDISDHTDKNDENLHVLYIYGKGMSNLYKPLYPINVENNSMTFRILCGLISAQAFTCSITGNENIKKVFQDMLLRPLRQMGAKAMGFNDTPKAPVTITGRSLKGIQYVNTASSDEIKSALLLAGLYARNKTIIYETRRNRNHMEILLKQYGARVEFEHTENSQGKNFCDSSTVYECQKLNAMDLYIPGDFTYAACFIAAALLVPDSDLFLPNVGVNSTRIGFLNACIQMGGDIEITNLREICGERIADLRVRSSNLRALRIPAGSVSTMIDELPLLCVLAAKARGTTIINGLSELKDADADCISYTKLNLKNMGIQVSIEGDCMIIQGSSVITGTEVISNGDYRLIMAMSIAGLVADKGLEVPGSSVNGKMSIEDPVTVEYIYPTFYEHIKALTNPIQ